MSDNFKEVRVDTRQTTPEEFAKGKRQAQLVFELNHTMPFTDKYNELVQELFKGHIGNNVMLNAPLTCVCADMVNIGNNVVIMNNCLMMARGGITIEDGAMIAANVQLISNNHDLHELAILTCKPVHIGKKAWIGTGAAILAGVTIGDHAVVGAGSVVTKDVAANTIVAGNPARFIKNVE